MAQPFGDYRLHKKIAQGGMAEVFLASQSGDIGGFQRQLAIKRMFPHLVDRDDIISMFIDEARIAARLQHPNIVQIYDLGEQDGTFFIAMEYVEGLDLRRVCELGVKQGNFITRPLAVHIISQVARGLGYAHERRGPDGEPMQIVHRDISPQNVLISVGGDVKLCDFGIAKAENRLTETQAGEFKGKFSYMSPEQFGQGHLDHRSDIFALGILLYETTVGTRLFQGDSSYETMRKITDGEVRPPSEIRSDYPPELERITLKALALKPEDRFTSAHAMEQALQDWLFDARVRVGPRQLGAYIQALDSAPENGGDVAPRVRQEPAMVPETTDERHPVVGGDGAEEESTVEVDPTVQIDLSLEDLIAMEAEQREASEADEAIEPTMQIEFSEERLNALEEGRGVEAPAAEVTDEYEAGAPTAMMRRDQTVMEAVEEETTSPMGVDEEVSKRSEELWQGAQQAVELEEESGVEELELADLEAMTVEREFEPHGVEDEEPEPRRQASEEALEVRERPAIKRTEAMPSIERPRASANQGRQGLRQRVGIIGGSAVVAIALGLGLVWFLGSDSDASSEPTPSLEGAAIEGGDTEAGAMTELRGAEPGPTVEQRIDSEPSGASVVVNGYIVEGQTPLDVELRQGATNEVWYFKPGYEPKVLWGEPEALEVVRLSRAAIGDERPLEVVSEPSGAAVRINGQRAGWTPLRFENAPVGRPVHLQVEADGHRPGIAWVELGSSGHDRVSMALVEEAAEAAPAVYDVIPEGLTILLQGQRLGQTPHRVSHRSGEWLDLEIGEQEQHRWILDLSHIGSVYLAGAAGER